MVIDHPPVNALDVAGWFSLAEQVLAAGRVPDNRVVIVRAEGRGFCAGVDIKEIQARGDEALIGANRGCFAAFAAVYECEVPVIAAVHGLLPRRWRGPRRQRRHRGGLRRRHLRAARGGPRRRSVPPPTCRRLVPQHRMRSMVYTAKPADGRRAPALRVGAPRGAPRASWWTRPTRWPASIAAKSPTILRRAKESLNGIDPVDVKSSYRLEQGFTYELHVAGVADEQRAAFVEKRDADTTR